MGQSNEMAQTTERPASPYELMGGEAGLRRLIETFYRIMDTEPKASGIRAMHSEDLGPITRSLVEWLSGWLGGPPLYIERMSSPCLTGPHRPFAIGVSERDQWLFCMHRALDEVGADPELRRMLNRPLSQLAEMVRNR